MAGVSLFPRFPMPPNKTTHSPEPDPLAAPSFFIKLVAQELGRRAEAGLRPMGVGMGTLPVLTALRTGQATTQAELARLLRVEQPSMAQTLARLERDGFIRRTAHPTNRRVQCIELTEEALKVLPRSKEVLQAGNDASLSGFSDVEKTQLLGFLKRMYANLSE